MRLWGDLVGTWWIVDVRIRVAWPKRKSTIELRRRV